MCVSVRPSVSLPLPCPALPPPLTPHQSLHHQPPTTDSPQVFVDGAYRPELSKLGNITGSEAWRAGSIHSFNDDPALQQELLAEISWAPEVGMRHTLAAGSLPFTSLNQVRACVRCSGGVGVWGCLLNGDDRSGSLSLSVGLIIIVINVYLHITRRACGTRPASSSPSAWRWTPPCRYAR